MKKLDILKSAFAGMVLCLSCMANAGVMYNIEDGILIGVDGVVVGDAAYNIEFINGENYDLFNVDGLFAQVVDLQSAFDALYDQAFGANSGWWAVNGCSHLTICAIASQTKDIAANSGAYSTVNLYQELDNVLEHFETGPVNSYNAPDYDYITLAKWSLAQVEPSSIVPEPTSVAIMGLGLLGLAGVRRRKNQA